MSENVSTEILSEITTFTKYRKYLPDLQRRETWKETCDRYRDMMLKKFPSLGHEMSIYMPYIEDKKILPSMRMLQFAGAAVEQNNARGYNCSFLPIDSPEAFSETMFLLLTGCGVGYSVQKHHVDKLPKINYDAFAEEEEYFVEDSIEGWADAIKELFNYYFGLRETDPIFNLTRIREKGALLVTSGGKAPGPDPLGYCIEYISKILGRKEMGSQLTPIECHDIQCHIANAVLAGGIRRAAMICLFSKDDKEMITCKSGNWWEENEQRGRANNSVVLDREIITKKEFLDIWKLVEESNAGEPGFYFTDNVEWGTNPCCEIALRPFSFCNLCEINVSDIKDEQDLILRAKAASFFGTLQATFTDFHYLRDIWREVSEEDRLIGVGMTGIASGEVLKYDLEKVAKIVKETNYYYATHLDINTAARCTTIKPSGTTSCVLGTSSGIHAWHSQYYIRRQRIGKNEALYTYLSINHPELLEDDSFRPDIQSIISIPQKAPFGAILREAESALDLAERVKKFNVEWVKEGHNRGDNTNNVSATLSIDNHEWEEIGEWLWNNRYIYNGMSVLPYDNGSYTQAPFEPITEEQYNEMSKTLKNIDLSKVVELEDNTNYSQESACSGNACEIPS